MPVMTTISIKIVALVTLLLYLTVISHVSADPTVDPTVCASTELDWYTSIAGETPCMSYMRLQLICDNFYTLPTFATTIPGDNCSNAQPGCCCNSVSFALSMLCQNCQQDNATGDAVGIDAPAGAYEKYLNECSPVTNQSLVTEVQQAACNVGLSLANFLYNLFWVNGDWYYAVTRDDAVEDQEATNNQTFTHCPQPSPSGTTRPVSATPAVSSSGISSTTSGGIDKGELAGIVIGGVAVVLFSILGIFWSCRRRRNRQDGRLENQGLTTGTMNTNSLGNHVAEVTPFPFYGVRGPGNVDVQSSGLPVTPTENIVSRRGYPRPDPLTHGARETSAPRGVHAPLPPAYDPIWNISGKTRGS